MYDEMPDILKYSERMNVFKYKHCSYYKIWFYTKWKVYITCFVIWTNSIKNKKENGTIFFLINGDSENITVKIVLVKLMKLSAMGE